MSTNYPTSLDSYVAKTDDVSEIVAADINNLQDAIAALENKIGITGSESFQAADADLTDIAGLAVTDGNFIVGDGANWVAESGATARTSLGLVAGGDGDIWVEKAGDTMTGKLTLDQNSNDFACQVDHEGTTAGAFKIDCDALTAGFAFDLRTDSTNTTSAARLIYLENTYASSTMKIVEIQNAGAGSMNFFEQTGALGSAQSILHIKASGANATDNGLQGLIFVDNNHASNVLPGIRVRNPNGANGATNMIMGSFRNEEADNTANVIDVYSAGSGNACFINQNGNGIALNIDTNANAISINIDSETLNTNVVNIAAINTSQYIINVVNAGIQASHGIMYLKQENASSSAVTAYFQQAGTGGNVYFYKYGVGANLNVQSTINSASDIIGIEMNIANAGAGLEYAFSFQGSEVVNAAVGGSQDYKIRIKIGGTDYFVPCNTA